MRPRVRCLFLAWVLVLTISLPAYAAQRDMRGQGAGKSPTAKRLILPGISPAAVDYKIAGIFRLSEAAASDMAKFESSSGAGSTQAAPTGFEAFSAVGSDHGTWLLMMAGETVVDVRESAWKHIHPASPPLFGAKWEWSLVGIRFPGITHSISGLLKNWGAKGYVFKGDPTYPLHFKAVKGRGYVYLCGRGQVTEPDGKRHELGAGQTAETLLPMLNSTDSLDRESAARGLAYLGDSRCAEAVKRRLETEKSDAVKVALEQTLEVMDSKPRGAE